MRVGPFLSHKYTKEMTSIHFSSGNRIVTVNHIVVAFTLFIFVSTDSYPFGVLYRLRMKSFGFLIECEFRGQILSFHNTISERWRKQRIPAKIESYYNLMISCIECKKI